MTWFLITMVVHFFYQPQSAQNPRLITQASYTHLDEQIIKKKLQTWCSRIERCWQGPVSWEYKTQGTLVILTIFHTDSTASKNFSRWLGGYHTECRTIYTFRLATSPVLQAM
jgi:hypothetical protein